MPKFKNSIFFPAKNKRLADVITIQSPRAFRESIKTLMKGGLQPKERKALVLARSRAKAQLSRKNLSVGERREFSMISRINIPRGK